MHGIKGRVLHDLIPQLGQTDLRHFALQFGGRERNGGRRHPAVEAGSAAPRIDCDQEGRGRDMQRADSRVCC